MANRGAGDVTAAARPRAGAAITAREAAAHVAQQRARPRATLLIPVAAAIWVLTEMEGVHVLRKPVPFLPVLVAPIVLAHGRRHGGRLKLPILVGAFVGWAVVSYFWTPDKYGVVNHTIEFVSLALCGWLIGSSVTRAELCKAFAGATRVIIVITAGTLVVAYHWASKPAVDGAPGWHGAMGHKNELGFVMAVGLLTMWFERPRPRYWQAWVVAGVFLLAGSQSGAGIAVVSIAAAIAIWEAAVRHAAQGVERRLVALGSWLLAVVGVVLAITDFPAATSLLGKNSTLTGRTTIWKAVWHAIFTRPLVGYGFGGVWLSKGGETARIWDRIGFAVYEAHDAWLDILIQLGVIGLLLAVAFLVRALIRGWSGFRYGSQADRWAWLVLIAFIIECGVESAIFGSGAFMLTALATNLEQRPAEPDG